MEWITYQDNLRDIGSWYKGLGRTEKTDEGCRGRFMGGKQHYLEMEGLLDRRKLQVGPACVLLLWHFYMMSGTTP